MAEFAQAFERMIANEGGYRLTNTKDDKGGQTYAGIARNRWPQWGGWSAIDCGDVPASDLVRAFYRENFWVSIWGDSITSQAIASSLFDFAVNAGSGTAIKLAQIVVGVTPDGKLGPKTLAALNAMDTDYFRLSFSLAKIARYEAIVSKDRSQSRFLLGWIRRTLKEAA